ncbi:uncharacterized protein LOC135163461 [Diachasmimorpha longicaudata]|uniref:uncharacterized protein LOC135163461 n=1 Tax=Diachasmimorpha longicaudata TaxID=58733 RepID=UPI0030B86A81
MDIAVLATCSSHVLVVGTSRNGGGRRKRDATRGVGSQGKGVGIPRERDGSRGGSSGGMGGFPLSVGLLPLCSSFEGSRGGALLQRLHRAPIRAPQLGGTGGPRSEFPSSAGTGGPPPRDGAQRPELPSSVPRGTVQSNPNLLIHSFSFSFQLFSSCLLARPATVSSTSTMAGHFCKSFPEAKLPPIGSPGRHKNASVVRRSLRIASQHARTTSQGTTSRDPRRVVPSRVRSRPPCAGVLPSRRGKGSSLRAVHEDVEDVADNAGLTAQPSQPTPGSSRTSTGRWINHLDALQISFGFCLCLNHQAVRFLLCNDEISISLLYLLYFPPRSTTYDRSTPGPKQPTVGRGPFGIFA